MITKSLSASLVDVRLLWMMLLKEIKMHYARANVSLPDSCSASRNIRRKRKGKQFNGNPSPCICKPVGVILFVVKEQPSTIAARSKPRSVFARSNREIVGSNFA
jgi:hypothetical protein